MLAACGKRNSGNSSMATAVSDVRVPLPPVVYASLRGASARWTYQVRLLVLKLVRKLVRPTSEG